MSDEMTFAQNEDGTFSAYDDMKNVDLNISGMKLMKIITMTLVSG
jgi:hypothetical protein